MDASTLAFYEGLADEYHLLYADWQKSIAYQREVLERLILSRLGRAPTAILDCSCGIGTQALGLASRGYRVHATDLSPRAVERAAREAKTLGVPLTTGVADLRTLEAQVAGTYDVVLSCDNALPHLLTDADLTAALRSMRAKLEPGGLLLASVRDYDALAQQRPSFTSERVMETPEGRRITFQIWDWTPDGRGYRFQQFLVKPSRGGWQTSCHTGEYRALRRAELEQAVASVGLTGVQWHTPEQSGYYQPIVTALAPA
jgi:glycine/sarcosine N-methyltransferase